MLRAPLLACGLAAASGSGADVSALVQRGAALHAGVAQPDSSCECLGWQDVYTKHNTSCGYGRELDFVGNIPGWLAATDGGLRFEFCDMFFRQLPNDKFCLNSDFSAYASQWCYVGEGCAQATPAQAGPLYRKTCPKGQDATLGDMKFEELAAYTYKHKLELGVMVHYAYLPWGGKEKLPDLQAFWGLEAPSDAKPIGDELRERLRAHVSSGKTVFLGSRGGHPPFAVSEGEKLYYINFNPAKAGFDHKEDMNLWGCVAGCGSANKPLW